jgi:hypothetical protein
MTTAREIVQRAYRKIGVTAHDDEMTDDQAAVGITELNSMMHGWSLRIRRWAHGDIELADEFPMPPQFHEGAVYLLAAALAPNFAVASFDPEEWFRRLAVSYLHIQPTRTDAGLFRRYVGEFPVSE